MIKLHQVRHMRQPQSFLFAQPEGHIANNCEETGTISCKSTGIINIIHFTKRYQYFLRRCSNNYQYRPLAEVTRAGHTNEPTRDVWPITSCDTVARPTYIQESLPGFLTWTRTGNWRYISLTAIPVSFVSTSMSVHHTAHAHIVGWIHFARHYWGHERFLQHHSESLPLRAEIQVAGWLQRPGPLHPHPYVSTENLTAVDR